MRKFKIQKPRLTWDEAFEIVRVAREAKVAPDTARFHELTKAVG